MGLDMMAGWAEPQPKTEGNVKLAVLIISGAETVSIAKKLLNIEGQNLRSALKQLS